MNTPQRALRMIAQEALGIRARLDALYPFALQMPMVPAANTSVPAQTLVERHMAATRRQLRRMLADFLHYVKGLAPSPSAVAQAQRRYALLKLYFQAALTHFDIFADVLTQRSQHGMGVWLAGLDVAATDALQLSGGFYTSPPLVCYVDRGHGAAIRRARTRLPGGGENPVAVIRIPRERMVGTGIASSLFHEVGHQAAGLLDLVNSVKLAMHARFGGADKLPPVWRIWERWISEILADLWSVARIGMTATAGLVSVVSLPRAFVLRISTDDPHPSPWIRVLLSARFGGALYPDPRWQGIERIWEHLYPRDLMSPQQRREFGELEAAMPLFVSFVLSHRPAKLRGRSIGAALRIPDRQPRALLSLWQYWRAQPGRLKGVRPTLAFAVLGQARLEGDLGAMAELRTISRLLERWALGAYRPYGMQLDRATRTVAA